MELCRVWCTMKNPHHNTKHLTCKVLVLMACGGLQDPFQSKHKFQTMLSLLLSFLMPWLTRTCLELMKKPVRNPSWHPHLLTLLHCRASLVSLPTLTSLIPWPHLQLPSIPQESTRRTLNSPLPLATVTVDELATDPQAKCRSKEALAVSNVIALRRSCEACLLSFLKST